MDIYRYIRWRKRVILSFYPVFGHYLICVIEGVKNESLKKIDTNEILKNY